MSHEDVSDRESKTIIERLIHLARTGKARIERRTVERIGITAPGADYPAIFITIDTDGDPITCNYVTDGMDDEDLHFTDENTLAELLSHRD